MGKKAKKIKGDQMNRPISLVEQIEKDKQIKPTISKEKEERPDDKYVSESLGKKITKLSQQQRTEEYHEESSISLLQLSAASKTIRRPMKKKKNFNTDSDVEEDDLGFCVPDNIDSYLKKFQESLNVEEIEKVSLGEFNSTYGDASVKETLKERLTERHTELLSEMDVESVGPTTNDEQVDIGRKIGTLLKKYRSGPLPKQLKRYPVMSNWEELICLTDPSAWSAAALYQVTRLFVANQPAHILQQYLTMVVLPRFRDDVSFFKKVNFHIYQTLCKCLYKPAAFHKGLIFPLCESGDCTLREAIILGSVIARKKVPILHAGSAIYFIAGLPYSGPTSIFLRIYLDKKYQLHYMIIDLLVDYFISFNRSHSKYPVLWHQSLLSFIQHYKDSTTDEQKDAILKLIRIQTHHKITPEIRREIVNAKSRPKPKPVEHMETA